MPFLFNWHNWHIKQQLCTKRQSAALLCKHELCARKYHPWSPGKSVPARKKLLCSPRSWPQGSPSHLALQKRRHDRNFLPGSKRFQEIHKPSEWTWNYADSAMRITPHRVCTWCLGTHGKRTLQCPNHQQIHAIDPKSWKWFTGVKRKPLLAAISP